MSGYSLPYRSNLNAHADDAGCGCANNLAARKYSGASVAKTFGVMRPVRGALSARASTAHSLSCSVRNLAIMLLYEKSRQTYADHFLNLPSVISKDEHGPARIPRMRSWLEGTYGKISGTYGKFSGAYGKFFWHVL